MDYSNMMPLLSLGIIWTILIVSGVEVPSVEDLSVSISDEEVLLYWKHPTEDSSSITYNVQMGKYVGEWTNVSTCTGITDTHCDLTRYIEDYRAIYKVRVQTVRDKTVSAWTKKKKVTPYTSKLNPPTFSVWTTSSSLTVYVQPKPVLKEIYAYGVTYTIHLTERGQEDKNITVHLVDDGTGQTVKTFTSLNWGVEYCVSVKVQGKGGTCGSHFSPQHCQKLPEQEWFVIAVSSLITAGALTVVVFMLLVLHCHLKRPRPTPSALKYPVSTWSPLTVPEARIEAVTDKGWFLYSERTKAELTCDLVTPTVGKMEGGDARLKRRRSLDSGVCMGSNASTDKGRQEDSGCESSTSSETGFSLPGETDSDLKVDMELTGLTNKGSYCSQKPSCHKNKMLKQIVPHSLLAKVVSGYRSEPQVCLCYGAGQCTWCLRQRLDGVLTNNKQEITPDFSTRDSITAGATDFRLLVESFPLLTSVCTQKDLNMNNVSISGCEVQLSTD